MAERILMIVESPNKIATLRQFLPSNYVVMASVGHIIKIADGGTYKNTGIDPKNEFKADYVVDPDKKETVKKLKEQVALADKVLLASDDDAEGWFISWSLRKFLNIPVKKCKRVIFHEVTKNAVLKAIENPVPLENNLIQAAQARQKLDKMLGYSLSPIARRSLGAKSVGRCQSAGLKLITDRENEILNFVPKEFGELLFKFSKNAKEFKAKYFGESLTKELKQPEYKYCEQVLADINSLLKNKEEIKVVDIVTKEKLSKPKAPFTTNTFQQEVANKLGLSVKDAMSCAQRLFEGIEINGQHLGVITYIRTDSPEISPDFIPELTKYVKDNYGETYYAPLRKYEKSESAQEGHEALRVTDMNMTPEILAKYIHNDLLVKVYTLIYKRTLAAMFKDSITSETTYSIKIGSHIFKFVTNELLFDGYLKVYTYKEETDDSENSLSMKVFNLNDTIKKDYLFELNKKATQPPTRYSEATFIKELQSAGIGRPSTFASILSTLLDKSRNYCTINDKRITPTVMGMELSKFLNESFPDLINIHYTSDLEKELDLIIKGKLKEIDFLEAFYQNLEKYTKEARKTVRSQKTAPKETNEVCPECGSPLVIRKSVYGEFMGCSNYPKCKYTKSLDKK